MSEKKGVLLSIAVPAYNEATSLPDLNEALIKVAREVAGESYEIIYCNDGSRDDTAKIISRFCENTKHIKLITLSRNFGKEIATTAALHSATGQAIITIDADGQHPPELIPKFVKHWQDGAKVVIGVRQSNQGEGLVKRWGSKIFYKVFNWLSGIKQIPGSSDFRLIDQAVQQEFLRLTERGRITRSLIDWLGYKREYVRYMANPRISGEAGYSYKKLSKLFVDSIVSMSKSPLYISAYLGAFILPLSVIIGLIMVIDAIIGDPLNWNVTGSAYVIVLLLFLVGVLLVSQGIIGLYLSHIHSETQNRPLYIVDKANSVGYDN